MKKKLAKENDAERGDRIGLALLCVAGLAGWIFFTVLIWLSTSSSEYSLKYFLRGVGISGVFMLLVILDSLWKGIIIKKMYVTAYRAVAVLKKYFSSLARKISLLAFVAF